MANISVGQIPWGPVDAQASDNLFEVKWVEPPSIGTCLREDKWIISGEKGSGKSAIIKAVRDIYKKDYFATSIVDFKALSFDLLYRNIVQIAETTNLDALRMLSTAWQYAIIAELIAECANRDPHVYKQYADRLRKLGRTGMVHARLESALEEIWNTIEAFTRRQVAIPAEHRRANLVASGGLTASVLNELRKMPIDDEFREVRSGFFKQIAESRHNVILLLDGFDRLRNEKKNPDTYNLIFSALADAVLNINTYDNIPPYISIKAVIPHDRYMNLRLRDTDKLSVLHSMIKWDRAALEDFVARRIEIISRARGVQFNSLWRQVFPDAVTNTRCGLVEDSFEYILRHTMYRPRHFQAHFLKMGEMFPGEVLSEEMVSVSIAESSRQIASYWIEEYDLDFPFVREFIKSLYQRENVFTYKGLRGIIFDFQKGRGQDTGGQAITAIAETLYTTGFLGILSDVEPGAERAGRYYPPSKGGKRTHFDFYFKSGRREIIRTLQDESRVAIHPIFNEHLDLNTRLDLVVG